MREPVTVHALGLPAVADLLDAPERARELSRDDAYALALKVASVLEALRLAATAPVTATYGERPVAEVWLGVDEVAARLGFPPGERGRRRVYKRKGLPWSRALGGGTLRMRASDLEAYMQRKRR